MLKLLFIQRKTMHPDLKSIQTFQQKKGSEVNRIITLMNEEAVFYYRGFLVCVIRYSLQARGARDCF